MVVGVLVGMAFPNAVPGQPTPIFEAASLKVLSTIFLRMIKSLIVPLIFSTLVVGIAGHGDDMKRVGKLALRSIVYFEIVTTLALAIGLAAVNIIKPGRRREHRERVGDARQRSRAEARHDLRRARAHRAAELLRGRGEQRSAANRVLLGALRRRAGAHDGKAQKLTMLAFCESLSEIMFKLTDLVMAFAPFGIGGAIAVTVGASGVGRAEAISALLIITLYIALVVFIVARADAGRAAGEEYRSGNSGAR